MPIFDSPLKMSIHKIHHMIFFEDIDYLPNNFVFFSWKLDNPYYHKEQDPIWWCLSVWKVSKLPKWLWGHLNCSGFSRNTYHRWKTRNFQICNIINLLTTRFHQLWSPNSNNIFITHQNTSDWLSNSEKISSDQLLDLCTMYLHTYDNLRSVINISKTIQNVEESASLIFTKLKKNTYPKAVIGKSNKDSLKIKCGVKYICKYVVLT